MLSLCHNPGNWNGPQALKISDIVTLKVKSGFSFMWRLFMWRMCFWEHRYITVLWSTSNPGVYSQTSSSLLHFLLYSPVNVSCAVLQRIVCHATANKQTQRRVYKEAYLSIVAVLFICLHWRFRFPTSALKAELANRGGRKWTHHLFFWLVLWSSKSSVNVYWANLLSMENSHDGDCGPNVM